MLRDILPLGTSVTALSVILVLPHVLTASPQANSWQSTQDGNWQDGPWSLGQLPGLGQSVWVTNAGTKIIDITAETAQARRSSLSIDSLTLSGSGTDSNMLRLEHVPADAKLTLSEFFTIGAGGILAVDHSGIRVGATLGEGALTVDGVVQLTSGDVKAAALHVGADAPGTFYLTNSVVEADSEQLGGTFVGRFEQYGGSNHCANLKIEQGTYVLDEGVFQGTILVGSMAGMAEFQQGGGTVDGSVQLGVKGSGTYSLSEGYLTTGDLSVPAATADGPGEGQFVQTGGTNTLNGRLLVGFPSLSSGTYTLSNGTLRTVGTVLGGGRMGGGGRIAQFNQSGGLHSIAGALEVSGVLYQGTSPFYAHYHMDGGLLRSESLKVQTGFFVQHAGTNEVNGDLLVGPDLPTSQYELRGGILVSSNCIVSSSSGGSFAHAGGRHIVRGTLAVTGSYLSGLYDQTAGDLEVIEIQVGSGGVFKHTGGLIVGNELVSFLGGRWEISVPEQTLGVVSLGGESGANSSLALLTSDCILRFADSSAVPWTSGNTLTIENWNGSASGGGSQQIYFGQNAHGLTPEQMSQIFFKDPAGFATGTYPAQVLSTGELVPVELNVITKAVAVSNTGRAMVIDWEPGYVLQTATNIAGPFVDMVGVASPYTNRYTEPSRFFRLRVQPAN